MCPSMYIPRMVRVSQDLEILWQGGAVCPSMYFPDIISTVSLDHEILWQGGAVCPSMYCPGMVRVSWDLEILWKWCAVYSRTGHGWAHCTPLSECLEIPGLPCFDLPFAFTIQTLAWWKLLILTGKKLAFKFSKYMGPSPLRPPHIYSHDECSQAFPIFCRSFTPMYYCEHKRKVKMGEAWEWG